MLTRLSGIDVQNLVIQFARKTGDYSALSHADLCILALTHALDKAEREKPPQPRSDEVRVRVPFPCRHSFTNELHPLTHQHRMSQTMLPPMRHKTQIPRKTKE
jgi:PIN domain of ribonuclease